MRWHDFQKILNQVIRDERMAEVEFRDIRLFQRVVSKRLTDLIPV